MLGWNDIVQRYITKYSNRIRKATQPLRDHFGIGYFTYHRIDYKGKYTVLVDRPDWAEHYVSEKIFLQDPYLRNADVYQPGICFLDSHGSEDYKKTVNSAGKKVLQMDSAAILIQKKQDCVEFFGFSGMKETCCLEKICLNDPLLLTSFSTHFKNELKSVLTLMESESSSLFDLKGKDFLCAEPIRPDISPSARFAYLADLGMKAELERAAKLSKRERQCLQLILQGKSSKESAIILGLSRRTIEFYLENIKNKLSCWRKQEIFTVAEKLSSLGLL